MIYWTIFIGSLIMGFSGALMPGPLLTVTINQSLRKGVRVGPLLIVGHAILELTLVGLILIGLGNFITLPIVKGWIGIIGGIFLLWMGYGILREAKNSETKLDLHSDAASRQLNPIVAGITVSAANPYWSIWWATVGASSLLLAGSYGLLGMTAFYTGHILSDFIWYSAVSFAVARGTKLFTALVYRGILAICGILLWGLAVYFVYSGVIFLRG